MLWLKCFPVFWLWKYSVRDNNSVVPCDVCSAVGSYVYVNFSIEANAVKNTLVQCGPNGT